MIKKIALYVMSFFYFAAGVNHFVNPQAYEKIIPRWLPYPSALNYISGAVEIIGALLLLSVRTRIVGAWVIILLLVGVFPANVQMVLDYSAANDPNTWLTIARLPLQLVFIWWAWLYTKKDQQVAPRFK